MKILKVTKTINYIVETDNRLYPIYRTDVNGSEWEQLMGESWEPVYLGYGAKNEDDLPELFIEHNKNNIDEPRLTFKEMSQWIRKTRNECSRYDGKLWHRKYGDMETINDLINVLGKVNEKDN